MTQSSTPHWLQHRALPPLAGAVGLLLLTQGAGWLLTQQQDAGGAATWVRLAGWLCTALLLTQSLFSVAQKQALRWTAAYAGVFLAGAAAGWAAARFLAVPVGVILLLLALLGSLRVVWLGFKAAPEHRPWAMTVAGAAASAALVAFLRQQQWLISAAALLGISGMSLTFIAGLQLLRYSLSGSWGIAAVARTVVDEAVRMRTALVLVVIVLVTLPVLPLVLDPGERLEYRVQFFITWSLGGSAFLLSMMTLLLACGTVTTDIETKRIHMSMTKPMARWEYLAGKWLGISALNLLLVALVGITVYAFVQILSHSPAKDWDDRAALEEQVLVARLSQQPQPPDPAEFERSIQAAIEQFKKDEPQAYAKDPNLAWYNLRDHRMQLWHTVSADQREAYVFTGLAEARKTARLIQLRLKPYANNIDIDRVEVSFSMWLNDRPFPREPDGKHAVVTLVSGQFHTLDIPADAITEDGVLRVSIENRNKIPPGETKPSSISFVVGKGLEVLYRVDTFETNMWRTLIVSWVKLSTLAMIGLATASMLSFPVAAIFSMIFYFVASGSAFLGDAIDIYTGLDKPDAGIVEALRLRWVMISEPLSKLELWTVFKAILAMFADVFMSVAPTFGNTDAVEQLATGRLVTLGDVGSALLWLGIVDPMVLGLIAWALFNNRDLAGSNT